MLAFMLAFILAFLFTMCYKYSMLEPVRRGGNMESIGEFERLIEKYEAIIKECEQKILDAQGKIERARGALELLREEGLIETRAEGIFAKINLISAEKKGLSVVLKKIFQSHPNEYLNAQEIYKEVMNIGFVSKSKNIKRDVYVQLYRMWKHHILESVEEGGVKKYKIVGQEKDQGLTLEQ